MHVVSSWSFAEAAQKKQEPMAVMDMRHAVSLLYVEPRFMPLIFRRSMNMGNMLEGLKHFTMTWVPLWLEKKTIETKTNDETDINT